MQNLKLISVLLIRMPALGCGIKIEFDAFDKASRVYMQFQHYPINPKMSNLQLTTMVSKLDVFRYGLCPFNTLKQF